MGRIMRILGIIAIMALLLGGVVLPVAATPDVIVSIDAPAQVAEDSDFTATVDIGDVVDLNATQYDVSFDNAVLRLDDVTSGQIDTTDIPVLAFSEISPGTYRVVQSLLLSTVSGSGSLAVLHFHAIGSTGQSSAIDLSNGMLSNFLMEEIPATWTGDSVNIGIDTTPPTVVSTSPEDNATDVAVDAVVSATFDENIQEGDNFGGITISGATGVSASIDGATLTIAHDAFAYETTYEVTIPAGAVNDLVGNPLAEAKVWSFTTVAALPGVVTVSIDAPAQVAEGSDFTATVDIGDVVDLNAAQYDVSFDNAVLRLDHITSGQIDTTDIPVLAFNEISPGTYRVVHSLLLDTVSGSGSLAVLHFHAIGSEGDSSAIDLSNGMLSNFLMEEITATWVGDMVNVVAVDTTPPTVASTSPVADATGVARGTTVSVTFSEAMDESTITTSSFTLDSVSGIVSYDSGTYIATFTPGASLSYNTTYIATLSTAITDTFGNPLDSAYSWSFTIRSRPTGGGGGGGGGGGDTTSPKISAISATNMTEISADIGWKTNEKSDSQVEYWASPGILSPLDTEMVTNHLISLTDLTPGTTHHFRVMSTDRRGNLAVSDEHTFATLGASPTFATSTLTISPAEVDIGETITISVLIANTGDAAGSYEVALKINGVEEATKDVTLNAGASEEVTFTLAKDVAGTYTVGINGLTGTFVVKAPTAFTISALAISPAKVSIGETVTISAIVTNAGDATRSYEVTLKIDDVAVDTKEITLAGGASEEVTFTISKDVAATYTVDVNGLTGEFVVKAWPNWWLIGGTIGGVIIAGVITFLVVKKRRA